MSRVLLVSNRLPVSARRSEGKTTLTASAGGLVSGLGPVHERSGSLWIGSLGGGRARDVRSELSKRRLVAVEVAKEQARRHYEGFSNQVLWPLFHYFVEELDFDPKDFEAYRLVNERFADTVVRRARPGDQVWVHDYHLMLLPAMLRERLPDVRIGFFLHVPFPSSEVFGVLPVAGDLLRGLLGADIIGLHTYDYARHLVTSFRRILGVDFDERWIAADEGGCRVGVFPLGVDTVALRERAATQPVKRRVESWRRETHGRKVILGVDRLDYTKGLPLRLRAFRRLLEQAPEWRREAVLVQIAVPSRNSIRKYRELKDEVERRVGEINGALGLEGRVPIWYLYRSLPPDELSALYQLADVALVTPIRDGMNLVAKEYVASRPDDSGVLVLSKFAGAASYMGEALLVNPWDVEGTAEALDRALRMDPEEQRQRMAALRRRVQESDAKRWAERFLRMLAPPPTDRAAPGPSDGWDLPAAFRAADHALLALDYDGTLSQLVATPERAAPDAELLELLGSLAKRPNVEVLIVSGRDRDTLARWFGPADLHLAAEHGLYLRLQREREWHALVPDTTRAWIASVREILEDYAARTPGSLIEEKAASIAWHYRLVERGFGTWQARELVNHLSEAFANTSLQVLHGARVVEVRQRGVHKGLAYHGIVERLGPFDLVVAAGDDRTDEDLFGVLPESAWSIKVGSGASRARFRLDTPSALRAVLTSIEEDGPRTARSRARGAARRTPAADPTSG